MSRKEALKRSLKEQNKFLRSLLRTFEDIKKGKYSDYEYEFLK